MNQAVFYIILSVAALVFNAPAVAYAISISVIANFFLRDGDE
jgi:putative flippase GtrA